MLNDFLLIGVTVLFFLSFLYSAIFGDNIRFEIEPNLSEMRYIKKGKLKKVYNLEKCAVGYSIRKRGMSVEYIRLKIQDEDGAEEIIDCEPLGETQFMAMVELMESTSKSIEEALPAT